MSKTIQNLVRTFRIVFFGYTLAEFVSIQAEREKSDPVRQYLLKKEERLKKIRAGSERPATVEEFEYKNMKPQQFYYWLGWEFNRAGFPGDAVRLEEEFKKGQFIVINDIRDDQGRLSGTETASTVKDMPIK